MEYTLINENKNDFETWRKDVIKSFKNSPNYLERTKNWPEDIRNSEDLMYYGAIGGGFIQYYDLGNGDKYVEEFYTKEKYYLKSARVVLDIDDMKIIQEFKEKMVDFDDNSYLIEQMLSSIGLFQNIIHKKTNESKSLIDLSDF